ncbi:MAG: flavodoxin-dependent (E)-4-hydroxy-3-methylbut-2-enyl-diphosphate synthase [Candidatus Geothermincolia bacterium]
MRERRSSKRIAIGGVTVGGGAPISVQTMTNTNTADAAATLEQIARVREAGAQLVRVSVNNERAARALPEIIDGAGVPIIADIHFRHTLALQALDAGVHGLRINPGNIGAAAAVREVARAAAARGVPIRVGVNAGSLPADLLQRYGHPTAEALVEAALAEIALLRQEGFELIKVSVKSSSVIQTVEAYRLLAERCDHPLHIGVSEAGPRWSGSIKSAVGLGILLADGIGDTMRVSLAADPVDEVRAAYAILKSLGLSRRGPDVIACPTCARTALDVAGLAEEVERMLAGCEEYFKVAVMGCEVNGPGEAREADVGVAGSGDRGLLFRRGEPVAWYPRERLLEALLEEIESMFGKGCVKR